MTDYLGSLSYQPHCERTQMTRQGRFVTTVEKCSRTVEGQERAQCSVAVYEFRGDKILNVWYYDAEACDPP
ncbi:MAG: hypothetical protein H6510_12590 [Acidobacteria bacterium]|nr:hypothetical protein [Acidobacteriota bacterium]MCB9398644.1 hypothetical protein [Acidobacteriota bacterium]